MKAFFQVGVIVFNLLLLIHKHIGSKGGSKWKICRIFWSL